MDRIQRMWNHPTPAATRLSHLLRCKGRRRVPRGAHGKVRAVGAALPALLPTAFRVPEAMGPHLADPRGAGIPQSVGTLAPGAHTRR